MIDIKGKTLCIGDTVAILHKKRPTTTATLQIGTVVWVSSKRCDVEVKGLNTTRHTYRTIIKL
jgi:hypothetical protein